MRSVYNAVYLSIFFHFLRVLYCKLTGARRKRVFVSACPRGLGVENERDEYRLCYHDRDGCYLWWHISKTSPEMYAQMIGDIEHECPVLYGKLEVHSGSGGCRFQSICKRFGDKAGERIKSVCYRAAKNARVSLM